LFSVVMVRTLPTSGPVINPLAVTVHFGADMVHVQLADGGEISVPLEWFPTLRGATEAQRDNWRLLGRGVGIRWEDLDEDISVESLLAC
jgi:hypothetical protein